MAAVLIALLLYFIVNTNIQKKNGNGLIWFGDYAQLSVVSGSMSGAIETGDVIVIEKLGDEDKLSVGDIVTFRSGSSLVTHRIVQLEGDRYITKGDANNTEDAASVSRDYIVGRLVSVIPRLGTFIMTLQSPLGMSIVLVVGILLVFIPLLLGGGKEDEDEDSKTAEDRPSPSEEQNDAATTDESIEMVVPAEPEQVEDSEKDEPAEPEQVEDSEKDKPAEPEQVEVSESDAADEPEQVEESEPETSATPADIKTTDGEIDVVSQPSQSGSINKETSE